MTLRKKTLKLAMLGVLLLSASLCFLSVAILGREEVASREMSEPVRGLRPVVAVVNNQREILNVVNDISPSRRQQGDVGPSVEGIIMANV